MTRWIRDAWGVAAIASALVLTACGGGSSDARLKEVQRVKSDSFDIVLLSEDGALNKGKDTFVIEFRKPDGALVDAGIVTTRASMAMPGMMMPGSVQVERSDVPGRYRVNGEFSMAGGWQMRVAWNGPAGQGSVSFHGTVQ